MLRKKSYLLILLFFSLAYISLLVINYIFKSLIWIDGYYPVYFGLLDVHYPLFSSWWQNLGVGEYPFTFNILLYFPLKLLISIFGNYLSWIVYIWLLFVISVLSFYYYLKKLVNQDSYYLLALSLLYAAYISLNGELIYYTIKIAAAFLPFLLYIILDIYQNREKISLRKFIVYFLSFSLITFNLIIFEPRSIIALGIIIFLHLVFFLYKEKKLKNILFTGVNLSVFLIGALLLYYPIKYPELVSYVYSGQLAVQTATSVVSAKSYFWQYILHPNPFLDYSKIIIIFLAIFTFFVYSIWLIAKKYSQLYLLSIYFLIAYLISVNQYVLQFLTVNLPYGQLFRTWEVSQYIAAFTLPILLVGAIFAKTNLIKKILLTMVGLYVIVSIISFNTSLHFVKQKNINPYAEVNKILEKDNSDYKVLWSPEMGWYGNNPSPYWIADKSSSGQAFPEFVSQKPTYLHYFTPMTPVYTWLASGYWRSQLQTNNNIDKLLNILGIKYLIIHDDINSYKSNTKNILNKLGKNKNFKLVSKVDYLYIFENLNYKSRLWVTDLPNTYFCESGLSCLSSFYKKSSPYYSTQFLTDQLIDSSAAKSIKNLYINTEFTYPRSNSVYFDLLVNQFLANHPKNNNVIFANDFSKFVNNTACVSDTHQGEYHAFLSTTAKIDYANNFTFQNCFFRIFPLDPPDSLPINIPNGKYILLVKYLKSNAGGGISLNLPGYNESIQTFTKENEAYYTYFDKQIVVNKNNFNLSLVENSGNNFIAFVAFIPINEYQNLLFNLKNNLQIVYKTPQEKNSILTPFNIKKISDSEWSMQTNSNFPSFLNFAEAYNPYWHVEVFSNNKKIEDESSNPGYGIINSFYIKNHGNLNLKLIYQPQEKYQKDFIVASFIFVAVLIFSSILYTKYRKL